MLYYGFEVEMALSSEDLRHSKMLRVMAHSADRVKAHQSLNMMVVIVSPILVAAESPRPSADAAGISLIRTYLFAQLVPL